MSSYISLYCWKEITNISVSFKSCCYPGPYLSIADTHLTMEILSFYSKGFEPGSDSRSCSVIVRVRVVLKRTVIRNHSKKCKLSFSFASGRSVTVTVTDNSPFQDYPHSDDHTTRSTFFLVAKLKSPTGGTLALITFDSHQS